MTPSQLLAQLRHIAAKISNSKSPRRDLVVKDLKNLTNKIGAEVEAESRSVGWPSDTAENVDTSDIKDYNIKSITRQKERAEHWQFPSFIIEGTITLNDNTTKDFKYSIALEMDGRDVGVELFNGPNFEHDLIDELIEKIYESDDFKKAVIDYEQKMKNEKMNDPDIPDREPDDRLTNNLKGWNLPGGDYLQVLDGSHKAWLKNGKYHREDGPAIIYDDGTVEYWLNGKQVKSKDYNSPEFKKRWQKLLKKISI